MDNPWIHCIPELLCQGPGLEPSYSDYSCIVMIHSDGTCYFRNTMYP